MSNFRVGQKVVCVQEPARLRHTNEPKVGQVYTIRATGVDSRGQAGVWLVEITNVLRSDGMEPGFFAHRFRPVVKRKTDISIFKRMLNPTKQREVV